jgi:predicted dehydrogenase
VRGDSMPKNHWINDEEIGGGRLLGEAVHFLDWMTWVIDKEPISVLATQSNTNSNSFNITLSYTDGSLGTLVYSMMGSPDVPKESIELLMGSTTLVIDNFKKVTVSKEGKRNKNLKLNGKGYKEQLRAFQKSISTGSRAHPNASDGVRATACAIAALKSINKGSLQTLDQSAWTIKEAL